MIIEGQIVDVRNRRIFSAELNIVGKRIVEITEKPVSCKTYILPGFIDAHIHIESSMLVPSEFAKIAVRHGTVATVSDPHEIANVLGVKGVEFMIENGKKVPFKFNFGAPSCVPATSYETSGAIIDAQGVKALLANPEIKYLAEMMNYPGVINADAEVYRKLEWAKRYSKPIDGHAPGLRGECLDAYIKAGISTDHECFTYDEALEKLQKGMKVLIREGSAAKNFEALIDLLPIYYNQLMFCSDDKHPDELIVGHINELVARSIKRGLDLFEVLQVACINPIEHYGLDVGLLREGDFADFITVKDLNSFEVVDTVINGQLVATKGKSLINSVGFEVLNNFNTSLKHPDDFKLKAESNDIKVIECLDGELVTRSIVAKAKISDGYFISNTKEDVLKIAVVNRYTNALAQVAFVKNMGLKHGAIASSVAHDSHNIIAVGVNDQDICKAINAIIQTNGGISAVDANHKISSMPLPVAGIMSDKDAETVAKMYSELDLVAKALGSKLSAPFMSLSFMALLVIPELKLSDKGLFDGRAFKFTTPHISQDSKYYL